MILDLLAFALSVAAFIGLIFASRWLYARYFPHHDWPAATPMVRADLVNETPENPFFLWFEPNRMGVAEGETLVLDNRRRATIDTVMEQLADWTYRPDPAGADWEPALETQREGDCEDYARVAAMLLIKAGIPAGCLTYFFGALVGPRGGWHAMLAITTDQGVYVSDCYNKWAQPWENMPLSTSDFRIIAEKNGLYRSVGS